MADAPDRDLRIDRKGGLRALGTYVPGLLRPIMPAKGAAIVRLTLEWSAIVGPDLARLSEPEKLSGIARGGQKKGAASSGATLRLRVAAGTALEFQHRSSQLLERINGYFGHAMIARLQFVQGPLRVHAPVRARQPPVDPAIRREAAARVVDIGDEGLRAALERLGTRILAGRTQT